jgi:hypothetical protein
VKVIGVLGLSEFVTNAITNELKMVGKIVDLSKEFTYYLDGIVINWKGKDNPNFIRQAEIVEKYSNSNPKIPLIIFDNEFSLSFKEFKWLNKSFRASFYEPVILGRKDYKYMPYTINILSTGELIDKYDYIRSVDIGYKGTITDKVDNFKQYFLRIAKEFPQFNFKCCFTEVVPTTIINEISSHITIDNELDMENVRYTIAIGSDKSYQKGHLESFVVDALNSGCNILIPKENKYFCGFSPLSVISEPMAISFKLNVGVVDVDIGCLDSTYRGIEMIYPEFTPKHKATEIIKFLLRR